MVKRLSKHLYFWVLVGIAAGALLGVVAPDFAVKLKPLGDAFITLLKMLIGPVVFTTIVLGICGAGHMKKVGTIGAKALIYFEVVSTLALIIGLIVGNLLKPGTHFHIDPTTLSTEHTAMYTAMAAKQTMSAFLLNMIPKTFVDAFTHSGDMLQILLLAVLFGFALNRLGEKGALIRKGLDSVAQIFFGMVGMVMKVAPIGAAGAMAFTIGNTDLVPWDLCFFSWFAFI